MPLPALVACCTLLTALGGQDDAVAPLLIVVTDAVTGAPLPEAEVHWLPLAVHEAALAERASNWPRDREAAVLHGGTSLALDADGRGRLDAPLGGLIVLASTGDRFLLREVASGASEVALALEVDVTLTITLKQPSGAPLAGASAGLWAGAAGPGSVAGSQPVLRTTTDSSGALIFRRIQTKFPELTAFFANAGPAPLMHVALDVVGERVAFPVEAAALTTRAVTCTAPPLGVVAVRLLEIDDAGRHASQAAEVRDVQPVRGAARGAHFSGATDGVARRLVPLGRRFEVRILDRRVLGPLTAVVDGPREEGEVVELGPLVPGEHAELRFVTGLAPIDLHGGGVVRVTPKPMSGDDFDPTARVLFGPSDFGPEGELTLLVPLELLEPPGVTLRLALWSAARELCAVEVTEGLAAGARIAAPLAAALARGTAPAPDPELLVTGFVVDCAGRRVPGAKITVLEDDPAQHSESFRSLDGGRSGVIRADAQGAFEVRSRTDALRFELRVSGAGFATQRVVVAERGTRDLCVVLGPTAQVFTRVRLEDDVSMERITVFLVEHGDRVRGTSTAHRMRHVGHGAFVVEAMAGGSAEIRVFTRASVGQGPRSEELLAASSPFDLGEAGGDVRAPDIDLCGRLVGLDPRAIEPPSDTPPPEDWHFRIQIASGEPAASPPRQPVVDLEVLDSDGRPFGRRKVQARWLWPGSEVLEKRRGAFVFHDLPTDALGRVSLGAVDVPLQHAELELELMTVRDEWPILHARTRWSAREARRSGARPAEAWTTVVDAGAVQLRLLAPAMTGRLVDRGGLPVVGVSLDVVTESSQARERSSGASRFDSPVITEIDSDGRFEVYVPSGSDPLVLRAVHARDGSVRFARGGALSIPRGARDLALVAERLATGVAMVTLAEGVRHTHIEVALFDADGTRSANGQLTVHGDEQRWELRGVEPGLHTLRVSVADSMASLAVPDQSERVLFESAPTPMAWRADGSTSFPMVDLTNELVLTQVAVALDGAAPLLRWDQRQRATRFGVYAQGGAGAIQHDLVVRDAWWRPRSSDLGGLELLTRSRAQLALEIAGDVDVRGEDGKLHPRIVLSEPTRVGAGVSAAEVALLELPPLRLMVSAEIVEALGPHHLYAIAWRSAAAGRGAPTASFGAFDARGELALDAPAPWPGAGETKVHVELALVSNLGQYSGDLAEALHFPRVRREMAGSYTISLTDGERIPKHVPRAERLLELDELEQPALWRRVLDTTAATPIRLDVDVAAVRAARALLERE